MATNSSTDTEKSSELQEDARTSVTGDEPGGRKSAWEYFDSRIGIGVSVVSALGVSIYLVLRTAYAVFYNSFDVAPEEVGLGQTEILVQSAVIVVAVLVVILGLALSMLMFADYFERLPFRYPVRVAVEMLENIYRPSEIVVVPSEIPDSEWQALAQYIERTRRGSIPRPIGMMMARAVFVLATYDGALKLALAVTAAALVGATTVLINTALTDASAVMDGRAVQASYASLKLLSWGASRVDVASRSDAGISLSATECYMYLGQSTGITVIYAVKGAKVLRLPSNSISVSEDLHHPSC